MKCNVQVVDGKEEDRTIYIYIYINKQMSNVPDNEQKNGDGKTSEEEDSYCYLQNQHYDYQQLLRWRHTYRSICILWIVTATYRINITITTQQQQNTQK